MEQSKSKERLEAKIKTKKRKLEKQQCQGWTLTLFHLSRLTFLSCIHIGCGLRYTHHRGWVQSRREGCTCANPSSVPAVWQLKRHPGRSYFFQL